MDNDRVLRAELKDAAMQNGLIRPEAVAVLPLAGVSLGANDTLQLPSGYFETARAAMPELFKREPLTSSSSTARPPAKAPPRAVHVSDMTEAERRAWMRAHGIAVPHGR